jgi:hypothetical protein
MKTKLKQGDKVVMHSCEEAYFPENYGKIWTCADNEFTIGIGEYRYIRLEGYKFRNNGDIPVKFLQFVDLNTR